MNKIKRIKMIVVMLVFIVGILASTSVQAFLVYKEHQQAVLKGGYFYPNTALPGGTFFCIQPGGAFHPSMTRGEYEQYPVGSYMPTGDNNYVCETCSGTYNKPWGDNTKYYYKYELTETINALEHQDAAYALAEACERGKLISWDTAYAIWESSISSPNRIGDYDLIDEAKAYKEFYELIHNGTTDNFENLIKDNSSNIDVMVKQDEGYYIVGPFTIEYPDGAYNGKNRFSWIEKIKAVTDAGTYEVAVLNADGAQINNFGKEGTTSLNNTEFYIKFYSKEATNVSLKIEFVYLESCSASMKKYEGIQINRNWKKETSSTKCSAHGYNASWDSSKNDSNGNGVQDEGEVGDWIPNLKDRIRYKAEDSNGSATQVLMALEGQATKNYKKVTKVFPDTPIDLTMKIAGYVFLDKDEGKVNEGNNKKDGDEGLKGVEVYLHEASGAGVNEYKEKHVHSGSSSLGTGCYTTPVYHKHSGNETEAIYHTHTWECYKHDENGNVIDASGNILYDADRNFKQEGQKVKICGKNDSSEANPTVDSYKNTCAGIVTYSNVNFTCARQENVTIDYYNVGCNKKEGETVESTKPVKVRVLTGDDGGYVFDNLNAMNKYYVEFVYNGMLYTNVARGEGNGEDISKSTEEAQGRTGNRQSFNDKFAEIKSYPNNYESPSRRAYNKVFLQEEIADTFKTIANNFGSHGNSDEEVFAYDCRISAYSTEQYPLVNMFTLNEFAEKNIGNDVYKWIYGGEYDQLHVNLGIKARPTFDLAIYKDVLKADVIINGQKETYEYDARKSDEHEFGFGINKEAYSEGYWTGVSEAEYLQGLREAYMSSNKTYANAKQTREIEKDSYDLDIRTEEIINGKGESATPVQRNINKSEESGGQYLNDEEYKINKDYNLQGDNRLKIRVTYKLSIRNQSNIVGAVTELVDYYDYNYKFYEAYVGNASGGKTGNVKVTIQKEDGIEVIDGFEFKDRQEDGNEIKDGNDYQYVSKYGNETQYKSNQGKYHTIYLVPEVELRLGNAEQQFIYITLELVGPNNDAGDLLSSKLPNTELLTVLNLTEINGYKTYSSKDATQDDGSKTPGLVDIDSNPGNLNISGIEELTQENIVNYRSTYEDDTSRAPVYIYKLLESRTIEGTVFEDMTATGMDIHTKEDRNGNGKLDRGETGIKGVIVDLLEIKDDDQMVLRATTVTNADGWYGFTGFLPGEYTIRYIYGSDDVTAMSTSSAFIQGANAKSYNGQDYQATTFTKHPVNGMTEVPYKVDSNEYDNDTLTVPLTTRYTKNNEAGRNNGERSEYIGIKYINDYTQQQEADFDNNQDKQMIKKYNDNTYYWYADTNESMVGNSDAYDDEARVSQVIAYSKSEYGREITNHKAEVFNSYVNPQPEHITQAENRALASELERRTYRYAYTTQMQIEVEYAKETVTGNQGQSEYKHAITGVDFGIVERPRSELVIDQDVQDIKVTLSDGTVLVDTANDIRNDILWANEDSEKYVIYGDPVEGYGKKEKISIYMDDELISGAKLEITYKITITNNSEKDSNSTTRAKTIINYVANNLNFDLADNGNLWKVVKKSDIQLIDNNNKTLINNELVDLSTQTTILQATGNNPIVDTSLLPGDSISTTLKLKKTLSAESSEDDLKYTNLTEIVEIDNDVGRYDHGAIPGNQSLEEQPREHDTSGASRYDEIDKLNRSYPPDGEIIITPPTGSQYIYYVLGITVTAILAIGIILIKKFVLRKE